MRVYLLRGDPDYHVLAAADGFAWLGASGRPVAGDWPVPRLGLFADDPAGGFLAVDCLPVGVAADGVVLSGRARGALGGVLEGAGELLPVEVVGVPYWWFNCLARVDALSATGTIADWVGVEGRRFIASTRQLAFRAEVVAEAPAVFRVPELPAGYLFARDVVGDLVERAGLIGFRLDLVWSSLEGAVLDPGGFGVELGGGELGVAKRAAAAVVLGARGGI